MRRSEICALDSNHISGNSVHVERAMVLGDNKEWIIKQPKSYAGNRKIVFPDNATQNATQKNKTLE